METSLTEIRHKTKAGVSGYKRWGCRCEECTLAGVAYREQERATRRRRSAEDKSIRHGVTGYRSHGCRCDVCSEAGALFLRQRKEAARTRNEPPVDWDALSYLRPGNGVKRRG